MNNDAKLQYDFIQKTKEIVSSKNLELGRKLTACVTTFGCQMNAKDSEKLCGILEQCGYEITEEELNADFVIFNTCTVRDNANQKVYGRLGALHHRKKSNPDMKIALCGCMMQEASVIENIRNNYKFVNLVFGTHNIWKFAELLYRMNTANGQIIDIWEDTDRIVEERYYLEARKIVK